MEVRSILCGDGANLHAQSLPSGGMFHYGFSADLTFLDQKMQVQQVAFALGRARLDEQSRRT